MRLQLSDGTLLMYRAIESMTPVQNEDGWAVEVRTVSGAVHVLPEVASKEAAVRVMDRIVQMMAACESV